MNSIEKRISNLTNFMVGLINEEDGTKLVEQYKILTTDFLPSDILPVFDNLFDLNINIEDMKIPSNKLFNILYKALSLHQAPPLKKNSFLYYLQVDNDETDKLLQSIRPLNREINKEITEPTVNKLRIMIRKLSRLTSHFVIIENVLFPVLERVWKHHQCVKLMWSYHDDIRRNLKKITEAINSDKFDLQKFNDASSQLYFDIYTIIFREERVLFPLMSETLDDKTLHTMLDESLELEFSFVIPDIKISPKPKEEISDKIIKLSTGNLTVKQIELIFNHLPVDITFVDKDDTVKYFSDPKHRIFPRTKSIIGRKVQNCHPHESVGVVTRIIESFKSGEKDEASFWIHLGKQFVLIRYFAVRDEISHFLGVLEVSQEISDIQNISGDRRLLDWE